MTRVALAGNRTRPTGFCPRGTSLGLVGASLLAAVVPFNVMQLAAPLTLNGFDTWLNSIPYLLALGMLPIFVFVFGLRSHQYWTVCLFYYYGLILLMAWALAVGFAITSWVGILPTPVSDLGFLRLVASIMLVLVSPGSWFLYRALRLRYWQPWTTPDQWEPGNETPPAWALSPTRRNLP